MKRLYRWLLRLYPAEFRGEFASQMERDFADELSDASSRNERKRFVRQAFVDVIRTAPLELFRELRRNFNHAIQVYLRTPVASLIAVIVLAIGIGLVTAFVSLYVNLVFSPYPGLDQRGRITTVGQISNGSTNGLPNDVVARMQNEMNSIEAVAAWSGTSAREPGGEPRVSTAMVSDGFFRTLRPQLVLGRGFDETHHARDAEPAVVISHSYWQRVFGGNLDVLGRVITLTQAPDLQPDGSFYQDESELVSGEFRVVGVMSESLSRLPVRSTWAEPVFWVPLQSAWSILRPDGLDLTHVPSTATYVIPAVGARPQAIASELSARYQGADGFLPDVRIDAIDGIVGDLVVNREARRQLLMFLAGSLLLLLAAVANLGLFLLARAPVRRREMGIRLAVGATRGRLARQLMTESSVLVLIAAILGVTGSWWLGLVLRGLPVLRDAQWSHAAVLDWRVLGVVLVLVVLLSVLVSLAPILGLKRQEIAESSRQTTARATLGQRFAGTVQLTLAGTLACAATAFGWYFGTLMLGDHGYRVKDLYVVEVLPDAMTILTTAANGNDAREIEISRWRESVLAIPGINAIAHGSPVPSASKQFLASEYSAVRLRNLPTLASDAYIYFGWVEPAFLDLLGLQMVHGRAPPEATEGIMVNQTLARLVWGRDDVVGETLSGDFRLGNITTGEGSLIAGVLKDVSFGHPSAPARPYAFTIGAGYTSAAVVQSDLSLADLEQAIRALDPTALNMQIIGVSSLEALRNELVAPDRARAFLTMTTTVFVNVLALLGFYGMQRYLVESGRREYAIRASIGAGPRAIASLVIKRGLQLAVPGVVLGGLLGFIAVALLRGDYLTQGISPGAVALVVVATLLLLVIGASWGPSRRAKRHSPAVALREG